MCVCLVSSQLTHRLMPSKIWRLSSSYLHLLINLSCIFEMNDLAIVCGLMSTFESDTWTSDTKRMWAACCRSSGEGGRPIAEKCACALSLFLSLSTQFGSWPSRTLRHQIQLSLFFSFSFTQSVSGKDSAQQSTSLLSLSLSRSLSFSLPNCTSTCALLD